jgi:hypothetical protein
MNTSATLLKTRIWPHAVTALNDSMCLTSDQWYMLFEKLPFGFSNVQRVGGGGELAGGLQQMKGASSWRSHGTSIVQSINNLGETKSGNALTTS